MDEDKKTSIKKKTPLIIAIVLGLFIIFSIIVMIANYSFPAFFEPQEPEKPIPGVVFTDTLINIGDQMFQNWLPNDKIWPTILLDNPQHFQIGELQMIRYTVYRLKENIARLRSADTQDIDCVNAYTLLSNDPYKWFLPSAESRFKQAIDHLKNYRTKLLNGEARFSPRADNLSELLTQYVSLLGGINAELAKAPDNMRSKKKPNNTNTETEESREETRPEQPFTAIDDIFYQAQGEAYVLRQMLLAIRSDFREVLEVKKAETLLEDIIYNLDQSQFEPWIVLNGDIGGLTANHSMELHSILENSRQKINNLIEMISQ